VVSIVGVHCWKAIITGRREKFRAITITYKTFPKDSNRLLSLLLYEHLLRSEGIRTSKY
jgi:hypothetical protein